MKTILAIAMLSVALTGFASAQEAPAASSPTWTDVQRACGTEYRETKGKADRMTWPDFLNECKGRKGFVPKRGAKADFRLPDVAKQ